jgi:sugar-specific transcriptional regulator TrmB
LVLSRFGFTPTENRVYQTLLKLGPSTGYAVALDLGVARANVYQALEALVRRGAGRKSATHPVQYAATGPAALVSQLEREFRQELSTLEDQLRTLPLAGLGGVAELELLNSFEMLMARAVSCADSATSELLAVTGPWAAPLNARFAPLSSRRVQVRAVSLGEPAPEGATARPVSDDELRAYWGGFPVAVVADRGRSVFGIIQAGAASGVATTSPGAVPFIRHLLRRELSAPDDRVPG